MCVPLYIFYASLQSRKFKIKSCCQNVQNAQNAIKTITFGLPTLHSFVQSKERAIYL